MIEYWTAQSRPSSTNGRARIALPALEPQQVIVVANRQPFSHDYGPDGSIVVKHAHSGVVHAVEPLIAARSGVWVAQGTGAADRAVVDSRDGLEVPLGNPAYRLRRVWLNEEEHQGFYEGFANEGLWPLCHRAYVKPVFRARDYHSYRMVNRRFVEAVCAEATTSSPIVLVQDYHFALAPRLLREHLRRSTIAAFWHIPWPHWRDLEICPWRRELLEGLLGSDLIGFQTSSDCSEFARSAERFLDASVNYREGIIQYGRRRVMVRHYPASIEWPSPWEKATAPAEVCKREIHQALGLPSHVQLGVSVDRLDYTKGLEEKFAAIECLLERFSDLRDSFAFVQLAQPTRGRLPVYRDLRSRVGAAVNRINLRFGSERHKPVIMLEADHEPKDVFRYLRAADLCFVASLQDGMNLVCKEFVSAHNDERGVLVLSAFAGAARELEHALLVNPWDVDATASVLAQALRMHPREQRHRMRRMRNIVARRSAHQWAEQIIYDVRGHATHESVPTASRVEPVSSRQHVKVIRFTGRRSDARS
jgi:trehalose 6-phosphate synthase